MESESASPRPAKKQRRHVSRACDICKAKRAKCDGTQPCLRCRHRQLECTYETPYLRGTKVPPARPSLLPDSSLLPESEGVAQATPTSGHDAAQATSSREEVTHDSGSHIDGEASRDSTPNEAVAEGYLGQSSNLAYSHAARFELTSRPSSPPGGGNQARETPAQTKQGRRKHERQSHLGRKPGSQSYLAFQERPFPPLNMARYSIPTTERGLEMASWYFENASPTYRILHRPSVERMITSMCKSNEWLGTNNSSEEDGQESLDSTEECTVLMVWALACQYAVFPHGRKATSQNREWLQRKGREYYQVAELTLEKDKTSLDKMSALQVRLMMCLYLLTTSRLKTAWDLFAVVKNMANNLDLSRLQSAVGPFKNDLSPLNLELRKRAFWAIYTLDTYLCVMLGKSLTFDEIEIRTAHPTADDELINSDTTYQEYSTGLSQTTGLSLMLCPMAHAQLARTVRKTLKGLYLGLGNESDQLVMEALSGEIRDWEFMLPDFLKMKSAVGLRDIYARQNTVIRLAQQHALIMVYRPSLPLSGLAARTTSSVTVNGFLDDNSLRMCQDNCLQAALEAHHICSSLFKKGEVNDHYWFTAYILFCAATVMLVHIAHNPEGLQAPSAWAAAQDCCQMQRQVCQSNRLARRYVAALEDLSKQLKKRFPQQMERIRSASTTTLARPGGLDRTMSTGNNHDQLSAHLPFLFPGDSVDLDLGANTSPGSQWDHFLDPFLSNEENATFYQFDSLVSGGMDFGFY